MQKRNIQQCCCLWITIGTAPVIPLFWSLSICAYLTFVLRHHIEAAYVIESFTRDIYFQYVILGVKLSFLLKKLFVKNRIDLALFHVLVKCKFHVKPLSTGFQRYWMSFASPTLSLKRVGSTILHFLDLESRSITE